METPDRDAVDEDLDGYKIAYGKNAPSYPEICSEFLTALAKSIKNTALYTLSHPLVIELLRKNSALLRMIFAAQKAGSVTLSFVNDSWLFNEAVIPAATQDSQNLNAFFRAHGVRSLTFLDGVRSFELGALCEFLSAPAKKQPEGRFSEFLAQKGVKNIRPEIVHYVKEGGYGPQASPRPAEAGTAGGTAPSPPVPPAESVLSGMNFGGLLTRLVESAIKDPRERVRVYEDALKMIRETMEQHARKTSRALAEEKDRILNTRTRTEKVLSTVAEGKVVVDKDGKVLMMNPAAEEIAGKKLADAVGRHISESIKPGEHILTMSGDMDLSGGGPLSGEVHVSGDENVGRAMRRSMALLEDDEGRVVGAYSTLPDITKFKEAQRMQVEFLSRVTHDLQSPLSSINSALEMLIDTASGKLDPDENKFLAISIRNSQRLTRMIRGILDFSKLQAGKMPVHPEPASVAGMLIEAGEGLLPWAMTKGLKLNVRPPVPDVMVMADHARIVQVLTNLISNAIKSTPKGGTISVAAAPAANREGNAVIAVRDTGRGIPKEDLGKVFEKFVQLEAQKPPDEPQEGVGLGLAIVKEFVSLHGGQLWANSEPGKGATFYFTLPLAKERTVF